MEISHLQRQDHGLLQMILLHWTALYLVIQLHVQDYQVLKLVALLHGLLAALAAINYLSYLLLQIQPLEPLHQLLQLYKLVIWLAQQILTLAGTAVSEGGNDHMAAIYYLHQNSWSSFVPGTASSNDIRVTMGSGATTADVTISTIILSGIDSTGTIVNTQTDLGSNAPATQSYTVTSTTNAIIMAAVTDGTGATETLSGGLLSVANIDNGMSHLTGYDVTASTGTYGWTGSTGKDSSIIVELNDAQQALSVTDTPVITDSATAVKTYNLSVTDTPTITDSATAVKTYNLSVTDTPT